MSKWFFTNTKKLEEVDFVDEEFQHEKIKYVCKLCHNLWCATEDIPKDACN